MAESSEDVKPGSEQLTIWFVSLRGGASLWPLLTCARKQQAAAVQPWPATAFWRRRGLQPSLAQRTSAPANSPRTHPPLPARRPPSPCRSIQLPDSSAPLKMKVKRSTKFEKVSARAQRSPPPHTHTLACPGALRHAAPSPLKSRAPKPAPPSAALADLWRLLQEQEHGAWLCDVCVPLSPLCACAPSRYAPLSPALGPCPPPPQYPRRCLAVLREGKKIEDTDTPESLEMDEGEVVDAQLQQTGGC